MEDERCNVLFLCTRNATRGLLAEALMNLRGRERFLAFSAGTNPVGKVSQPVLDLLRRLAIPTEGLRSKSWCSTCLNEESPSSSVCHWKASIVCRFHTTSRRLVRIRNTRPVPLCFILQKKRCGSRQS
jgi:protein-tyrosine-phosphatase